MSADSTATQSQRLLLLCAGREPDPALLSALRELGSVSIIAGGQTALDAIEDGSFDLVVAEAGLLLPLAKSAGRPRAEAVFEDLPQGVCIMSREGVMLWANSRMRAYPAHAIETVRQGCARLLSQMPAGAGAAGQARSRRACLDVGTEYCFDVTVTPIGGGDGNVPQVVVFVADVTASRRLQDKLNAIDAAGAELVRLDSDALAASDVAERLEVLEHKLIRYTRDLMHFDHFCVRVLDRRTNRLDTVLAGGMSAEAKSLAIYALNDGNGISGYVAATGRSYICADVAKDSRYLPGIDNARSSLTVPLRLNDQIVGILNVESERVAAFSEDDRQFAEIFGRYVAIALHMLRLLAVERSTATQAITSDVAAELSGPINDVVTDANTIIEDYIGHDDLRRRLHLLVDRLDRVKRTIAGLAEHSGVIGAMPVADAHDPVMAGRRVLIAEDEDLIRDLVSDSLTHLGAKVTAARDGREALAAIESSAFDLVLSDIKMPCADGYEIFSAVKKRNINTPVILITGFGYDPSHSIVRASKEGLAAVLYKPFKIEQLLEDVRHALTSNTI